MDNHKNNTILYTLIIILCLLVLGLGGYIVFDKISDKQINSNANSANSNSATGVEDSKEDSYLTGKINFNDYCTNNSTCEKEIGNININNQTLKLSVNIKNVNTENISGDITLGTKKLNISNLSYFGTEKVIDGFEVYQNYLILYMSSLDTMKSNNSNCEVKGYMMYILNSDLEEVSGLAGYTKNSALKDFKIENDYLYYYALSTENGYPATLVYEKINFNDLLNKKYDSANFISNINECKFGE